MSKRTAVVRFLLPSLAGAFFFLTPIRYDGSLTIPMGIVNGILKDALSAYLSAALLVILVISAVFSLTFSLGPARWTENRPSLQRLFKVSGAWLVLRATAVVFAIMIATQTGPEIVWGEATGRVVYYDLAVAIITIFTVAIFLLPLLTDFGLMELVGAVLSPVFRRLFTLPGRSAVDASASWLSAAAVGVLITSQQYERACHRWCTFPIAGQLQHHMQLILHEYHWV